MIHLEEGREVVYTMLKEKKLCVHVMSYIEKKTETVSVRSPPYPPMFPNPHGLTERQWYVGVIKVGNQYLPYSFGLHDFNYWNDAHWPYGVAVGHDPEEPGADELCELIHKKWQEAENAIDFLAILVDEDQMNKLFHRWHRIIGYIDLDRLSWRDKRDLKRWVSLNSSQYRVIKHWMYTKNRWDGNRGMANNLIFGLRPGRGEGGDYLNVWD
ncbi:MAG: hypothetical protein QXU18_08755 [Thermoplasmatales archaeon]